MVGPIQKFNRSEQKNYHFSILLPSWNNLDYLRLCIDSIRKNSSLDLQIIILVNEGSDGSLEWVHEQEELDYVYAEKNIGICYGLNACRSLVKSDHILYINDDMYVLPDWDQALWKSIQSFSDNAFFLSATMIEANDTGNSCVVLGDYGQGIDDFKEDKLLSDKNDLIRKDWTGATWPPNIMHKDMWDLVGGMSVEYHPGMYSDPDLSKKLYDAGVREFKGCGSSLVYHFGSKSTRKLGKNTGRQRFILKWGMSSNTFTKRVLKMGEHYSGPLEKTAKIPDQFLQRLKRIKSAL